MLVYHYEKEFTLENGAVLQELHIAYDTWGRLNENRDNVIWICHALTANSNAAVWWPSLVGADAAFNTNTHFVVCANILGSCYGTTGPASIDPATGNPYYKSFPAITIRDMVKAHELLRQHLQIQKIALLAGGSMGGYQAMEWCAMNPALIERQFLIVTSAKESAWGIAVHTAQRMAIETDSNWNKAGTDGGSGGLKVARAIGMLTYRSYELFANTQTDTDPDKTDDFKASAYIHYQGDKLVKRFNTISYWLLTKAMDTHNLARHRGSLESVLKNMRTKTLLMGIESDLLCPVAEQKFMAAHLPDVKFAVIESAYGHDGFLVETEKITTQLSNWFAATTAITV